MNYYKERCIIYDCIVNYFPSRLQIIENFKPDVIRGINEFIEMYEKLIIDC